MSVAERRLTVSKTADRQGIVGLVIVEAAVWIFILTAVVLDFAGIRLPRNAWRGTGWRWMGIGILIISGEMLVDSYADARGGPYPRTPLHAFSWPVLLTGVALILIGVHAQRKRTAQREPETTL